MIVGANWYYSEPKHVPLKLFRFKPAIGGHANDLPELNMCVRVNDAERAAEVLEKTWKEFPDEAMIYRSSANDFEVSISRDGLFDYDLFIASVIEKRISSYVSGKFSPDPEVFRAQKWNHSGKTLEWNWYTFSEKEIHCAAGWGSTRTAGCQQLKIFMNLQLIYSMPEFERDFLDILIRHDLDFAYYSEMKGSVELACGNGRQGVDGVPLIHLDPLLFERDVARLSLDGKIKFGLHEYFTWADHRLALARSPNNFIRLRKEQDRDFIL